MNPKQKQRLREHQKRVRAIAEQRKKQQQGKPTVAKKPVPQKPKHGKLHANKHVTQALPIPPQFQNITDRYNECYIVGGGPSLKTFDWTKLNDKFVIAINRAYEVLPNAHILYFTDPDYWQRHKNAMIKHGGFLMRGRLARRPDIKDALEIQLQQKPAGWSDQFGEAFHGSNSAYPCIQVAHQFGFKNINLLGLDMKHVGKFNKGQKNNQGVTHWHNGHKRTDPPTAYTMMLRHYSVLAKEAKNRGVNIVNISPSPESTALKEFPIHTFDEHFK